MIQCRANNIVKKGNIGPSGVIGPLFILLKRIIRFTNVLAVFGKLDVAIGLISTLRLFRGQPVPPLYRLLATQRIFKTI